MSTLDSTVSSRMRDEQTRSRTKSLKGTPYAGDRRCANDTFASLRMPRS